MRHWHKGSRVYAAYLHQTLFGDWQVERTRGGKGRCGGRTVILPAASYREALELMRETVTRRQRRGYLEIEA